MDTENKLRMLVSWAIHHLSCGYTSNSEREKILNQLRRGLMQIDNEILKKELNEGITNEREKIINAFKEKFGTPISETDREYLLAFAWFEKGWNAVQQKEK